MLIHNTNDLNKFIADLGTPPYVAIDTEFISEKTYYPQLCLVQVAYGDHAAVIDPLSDIDLNPLITFLENHNIVKVFHAAHQDLAIFWNNFKFSPTPVFDTQIAAMVCGYGDQVSYGQLVKSYTNTTLDKSAQIIDWSKRPLLKHHLKYAIADVTNLGLVYEKLLEGISGGNRSGWITDEMESLSISKRFEFNPETQMKKVKMRGLSRRRCVMLYELICWREDRAKTQDIPRGWVLKDITLRDLVSNPPQNMGELERIRGIGGNARGQLGQQLLERIRLSKTLPLSDCPLVDPPTSYEVPNENALVLLRALLKHACEKHKVAPKLLASKSELEEIAVGTKNRIAQGWRWEIFGKLADQLLKGQIALALVDGKMKFVPVS